MTTRNSRNWDIEFSPDGRFLVAAVGDYLQIWDSNDLHLVSDVKRHEDSIIRIAMSWDGLQIATVGNDMTVRVSSLPPSGKDQVLLGHRSRPRAAAFSSDARRLATGAEDGTVRIWDLATGQELLTLKDTIGIVGPGNGGIRDLAFRDDKTLLAVLRDDEKNASYLAEWRAD